MWVVRNNTANVSVKHDNRQECFENSLVDDNKCQQLENMKLCFKQNDHLNAYDDDQF